MFDVKFSIAACEGIIIAVCEGIIIAACEGIIIAACEGIIIAACEQIEQIISNCVIMFSHHALPHC